jgi:hypothetical protein
LPGSAPADSIGGPPVRRRPEERGRSLPQELQPVELTVVDTTTAEWVGFPIPELGVDLELIALIADPDRSSTGVSTST